MSYFADIVTDAAAIDDPHADDDVYAEYVPKKLTEGTAHPDPVVETSSLASVTPPDIVYKHHLQV